jgi:hypothetical protein
VLGGVVGTVLGGVVGPGPGVWLVVGDAVSNKPNGNVDCPSLDVGVLRDTGFMVTRNS